MTVERTDDDAPGSPADGGTGFALHLDNFEGPFDLLLQLIGRRRLDVTEIALSAVTDEFLAYLRRMQADAGDAWDLDEVSEFVVVAATLLDLKAARLLPSGEVEDAEDIAALEARDLLFARLLQYRAFKIVAGELAERLAVEDLRQPRPGGLEEAYARLLPELRFEHSAEELAFLAGRALTPPEPVHVSLTHLHAPQVSVREQAALLVDKLSASPVSSFRTLVADATSTLVVVARFLALLELFRDRVVVFEQLTPLGELTVRWLGGDVHEITDDYEGTQGEENPDDA
ncbi:segregation and condensation protein A [Propionicicella superfundia]|uniref:segregation and condensation protein A n=1 Tax=Propionicicella superfundia TaxID=348582 RepID=UPI000404A251|nr:ScpA family protein [Propionicicella superfundia]